MKEGVDLLKPRCLGHGGGLGAVLYGSLQVRPLWSSGGPPASRPNNWSRQRARRSTQFSSPTDSSHTRPRQE